MSRGLDSCNYIHLYRTLRPDESPHRDIVCKDRRSNRSVGEHVEDGLKYPSRFISATASFERAERWRDTSFTYRGPEYSHQSRRTTIIEIDLKLLKQKYPEVANSAYDFTHPRVRSNFLTNELQMDYARAYREVVFDTRIPLEAISRIHEEGKGWVERVPKEQQAPVSAPELSNPPTAAPTPLVVNNNTPLPIFEPTPDTHTQSITSSITNEGAARLKRKLTNTTTEPPQKYICAEAQVIQLHTMLHYFICPSTYLF